MKRVLSAALAAATLIAPMSVATTASAQSYRDRDHRDGDRDRDRDRGDRRDRDRDRYDHDRGRRDNDWNRGRDRRDRWDDRRYNGYYRDNRWYYGPPPAAYRDSARYDYRGWRRGDRLPGYYRDRYMVVSNYDRYHLRRPPRGYHYVRDDRGDYLLVGIATGVILGIIASQ
jgi:Ni/Co efflux regulator RcnB